MREEREVGGGKEGAGRKRENGEMRVLRPGLLDRGSLPSNAVCSMTWCHLWTSLSLGLPDFQSRLSPAPLWGTVVACLGSVMI